MGFIKGSTNNRHCERQRSNPEEPNTGLLRHFIPRNDVCLVVLFLLSFFVVQPVKACMRMPSDLSKKEAEKIVEEADFIGIVQVLSKSLDVTENSEREFISKTIKSYKSNDISEDESLKIMQTNRWGMCRGHVRLGYEGQLIEVFLKKRPSGSYEILFPYIGADLWRDLRSNRDTGALMDIKRRCADRNGNLIGDMESRFSVAFDCEIPANDQGKKCSDSSQCYGFCIIEKRYLEREDRLMLRQRYRYQLALGTDKEENYVSAKDYVLQQMGECSALKSRVCGYFVENGEVSSDKCLGSSW